MHPRTGRFRFLCPIPAAPVRYDLEETADMRRHSPDAAVFYPNARRRDRISKQYPFRDKYRGCDVLTYGTKPDMRSKRPIRQKAPPGPPRALRCRLGSVTTASGIACWQANSMIRRAKQTLAAVGQIRYREETKGRFWRSSVQLRHLSDSNTGMAASMGFSRSARSSAVPIGPLYKP